MLRANIRSNVIDIHSNHAKFISTTVNPSMKKWCNFDYVFFYKIILKYSIKRYLLKFSLVTRSTIMPPILLSYALKAKEFPQNDLHRVSYTMCDAKPKYLISLPDCFLFKKLLIESQ